MNDPIVRIISDNKDIFSFFDEVYLFGSTLKKKSPNDIDILLVYKKYSLNIRDEKLKITSSIKNIMNKKIFIDFTTLSKKELIETNFLEIIHNYMRIL